jgi:tRNA(adenine34) deaminase
MCLGAILHARIDTLVYGVPEPKTGAIESFPRSHPHPLLKSDLRVVTGVLASECRDRLRQFFEARRGRK